MNLIEKYGVVLRPLEEGDLERVRKWRNAAHVQANFEFQKEISPAQHLEWFRSLDFRDNWYWVIQAGKEPIGVVHLKDIKWDSMEGEAGVFIGEKKYLNSPEPVWAVLAMMDFAFLDRNFHLLTAKIHTERSNLIQFNRMLGYVKCKGNSTASKFEYYECTKDGYLSGKMRKRMQGRKK